MRSTAGNRGVRGLRVSIGLSLALLIPSSPAQATTYSFTNIADSTSPTFSGFTGTPSANDSGAVAFWAGLDVGGSGVFKGSGGPTTTIGDTGSYDILANAPDINNDGTVAMGVFFTGGGGNGIVTGDGGPGSTYADISGSLSSVGDPSINTGGTVAFRGSLDAGGGGIFTGAGGSTTIADTTGVFTSLGTPDINDGGTVTFWAGFVGGSGVYTGSGGPLTTIAEAGGSFLSLGDDASINTAGTVAFYAGLDAGGAGIYTGSGGPTATIADTSGPYSGFGSPAINAAGTVAFLGFLDAGGKGIYTGADPVADKIIQVGDPLFGSTLSDLDFLRGMNDNGDVAFRYTLASGVTGIAIANVPEPATAVLIALGGICLMRRRSSRG